MAKSIRIEKIGRRLYAFDTPYETRDRLRGLCTWDPEKRAWWCGTIKEADLRALVTELQTPRAILADQAEEAGDDERSAELRKPVVEDLDGKRVYAAVTYKGRRYYVVAEQRGPDGLPQRVRLATLDKEGPVFWADAPACELIRTYEGRERWDGRRYSGKTVTVYPTIGSLRRFRDRQANPDTARVQCPECDSWHDASEACRECGGS